MKKENFLRRKTEDGILEMPPLKPQEEDKITTPAKNGLSVVGIILKQLKRDKNLNKDF